MRVGVRWWLPLGNGSGENGKELRYLGCRITGLNGLKEVSRTISGCLPYAYN